MTSISSQLKPSHHASVNMYTKWASVISVISSNCVVRTVTGAAAHKYQGDFFGLLKHELYTPIEYWAPILLVNGYDSSSDYDGTRVDILIPDTAQLTALINTFYK